VYKAERMLHLHDVNGQVYRSYKIALGGNPVGHKQFEGDRKTPEGLYYIETRNPNSRFHLSLKISYPNEQDRAYAESLGQSPGGDIFIHGVPNEKNALEKYFYRFKEEWTEGCIALTNRDMEELWSLVGDGTPIMIYP
jgi:murein L,D-transpeptidase YafK